MTVTISSTVYVAVLAVVQIVSGQVCTVGRVNTDKTDNRRPDAFYLNRGHPASCNGWITSISYCYFAPEGDLGMLYVTTFGLYRPQEDNTYTSVSESFQIRVTRSEIENRDRDFGCSVFNLEQTIPVHTGDILGACVVNSARSPSSQRLDIVGINALETGSGREFGDGDLLRVEDDPPESCNDDMIPQRVTTHKSSNRALYLYANILSDGSIPSSSGEGAAAIVVLSILIVVAAILTIGIAFWIKKRRQASSSTSQRVGAHNVMYLESIAEASQRGLTQSQDHVYEFDVNYDGPNYYAVAGPVVEMNATGACNSPLDEPAISFAKLLAKVENPYAGENPYERPAEREDEIYAQFQTWGVKDISPGEIEITGHLGSGQFGSVEQGVWKRQGTKPVDVALKSLTKTSEEDKVKFLQEAAIMAQFNHLNVITLHGIVTGSDPMMLVVELAKNGDLQNYLVSNVDPSTCTPTKLLRFSQQVALGMQYLSTAKGFVHRDLAARNVLLSGDNICKVADFGLSRDLADEDYYVSHGNDKIPVKWTAPEAIHYKKYSTASDVWSYGCLLYEIWSVGHKPFEGVTNLEAIRVIDSNKRLAPPPGCPKMIYQVMIHCWHPESSGRPSFRDIVLTLVGSEEMVLNIPEEDSSTNPLAGVLGAPLEAGENMYSELRSIPSS